MLGAELSAYGLLLTGVLGGGGSLLQVRKWKLRAVNDLLKTTPVSGGDPMSLGFYDFKARAVGKPLGNIASLFPAGDAPVCSAPLPDRDHCPPRPGLGVS